MRINNVYLVRCPTTDNDDQMWRVLHRFRAAVIRLEGVQPSSFVEIEAFTGAELLAALSGAAWSGRGLRGGIDIVYIVGRGLRSADINGTPQSCLALDDGPCSVALVADAIAAHHALALFDVNLSEQVYRGGGWSAATATEPDLVLQIQELTLQASGGSDANESAEGFGDFSPTISNPSAESEEAEELAIPRDLDPAVCGTDPYHLASPQFATAEDPGLPCLYAIFPAPGVGYGADTPYRFVDAVCAALRMLPPAADVCVAQFTEYIAGQEDGNPLARGRPLSRPHHQDNFCKLHLTARSGPAPDLRQREEEAEAAWQAACGLRCEFVSDLTIPDGTPVRCGQRILKKWLVRNSGDIPWPAEARLRCVNSCGPKYYQGRPLGREVPPDAQAEVEVELEVPKEPGTFKPHWRLCYLGRTFSPDLWLEVEVVG